MPRPTFMSGREGETHGTTCVAFEGPVNRARVAHEVRPGPRIPSEELVWQHVPLESIAWGACRNKVARCVGSSLRDRVHVIERGHVQREWNRAVDAAATAITHGSVLECALDAGVVEVTRTA